jgi:heme-degrading monooxygenase HmoA
VHARISTVSGVTDFDNAVAYLRDTVLPELRQQAGFSGLTASGDRDAGTISVLSIWATEADLHASESAADKVRGEFVSTIGGNASVERYEQVVAEIGPSRPEPGSKLQIRPFKTAPEKMEENLARFREAVLPELRSLPGFQSIRQMVNRRTGEGVVGTVWADEESSRNALSQANQRRAAAAERGVELGEISVREVLWASMP